MGVKINTSPLCATYKDAGDTDYDKEIEKTREIMKTCDPEQSCREMRKVIATLFRIKNTYYSRPCIEGYCFNIFTPHRSKIQRRITDLSVELEVVHKPACQEFLRDKKQILEEQDKSKIRQDEKDRFEKELEAKKAMHEREIEAKEKIYLKTLSQSWVLSKGTSLISGIIGSVFIVKTIIAGSKRAWVWLPSKD